MADRKPLLSILIPVYNEKDTVMELLDRVRNVALPLDREIIIVDDGSQDGTTELLKSLKAPNIKVHFHEKNQGKGAALRTAIAESTGDYFLIQDADLEYDPRDIPALLEPLLDGRADVVYGSRFLGGPHRVLLFWHYFANRSLTLIANILYDVNLTDMGTCYKGFVRSKIDFPLRSNGFGFEAEITAKVAKRKLRMYEIPISYSGRTYAEGKKITWKDGFVYLWCLLKYRVVD